MGGLLDVTACGRGVAVLWRSTRFDFLVRGTLGRRNRNVLGLLAGRIGEDWDSERMTGDRFWFRGLVGVTEVSAGAGQLPSNSGEEPFSLPERLGDLSFRLVGVREAFSTGASQSKD
jgi:hypothetical protein